MEGLRVLVEGHSASASLKDIQSLAHSCMVRRNGREGRLRRGAATSRRWKCSSIVKAYASKHAIWAFVESIFEQVAM